MIPYIGNKSSISDFIKQYVPKNPKKWVEPFGGTFGLYFTLNLNEYPDTEFIYNDINPLNCILFHHLKDENFIKSLKKIEINKDLYDKCFKQIKNYTNNFTQIINSESDTNIDSQNRAFSWLVLLCCSDIRNLTSGEFKNGSQFNSLKNKLPYYIEYFKRIQVSNLDYLDVINLHENVNTFFYLDPPYIKFEDYYVFNTFKGLSHDELAIKLEYLKSKWILSYFKIDKIEKFYSKYKILTKRNGPNEELLILSNNI